MDGKLLILCDEEPGDYEHYSVKDANYFKQELIDPSEDSQMLFVSWDSIIPNDPSFINECINFARTYEEMPPDFFLRKKGAVDLKSCNSKTSIQEESYYEAYESNIERIRAAASRGEDYQALAIDLAHSYSFLANDRFLGDLSYAFKLSGVVRILPAYCKNVDPQIVRRRMMILEAWVNKNNILRENASRAEVLDGFDYGDFGEVYSRAGKELISITALPIFGGKKER